MKRTSLNKVAASAAALILTLTVAGCNSSSESAEKTATPTTVATASATPTTEAKATQLGVLSAVLPADMKKINTTIDSNGKYTMSKTSYGTDKDKITLNYIEVGNAPSFNFDRSEAGGTEAVKKLEGVKSVEVTERKDAQFGDIPARFLKKKVIENNEQAYFYDIISHDPQSQKAALITITAVDEQSAIDTAMNIVKSLKWGDKALQIK